MTFSFEWGASVICTTIVTSLLLIALLVWFTAKYFFAKPFSVLTWNLFGAVVVIFCVIYLMRGIPLSMTVSKQGIKVKETFSSVYIPAESIKSIRVISDSYLGEVTRENGSGGFGGYTGLFRSSAIGVYESIVTDRAKPLLLIDTTKGKYVIGASAPDAVVKALGR